MKIKNLFIALFAVSALFACNDDESPVPDNNKGTKSISVSLAGISGVKTRATEAGNFLTKDTMNVNSVLINLTDASGAVVKSETITKDVTSDSNWDKLVSPDKGYKFINVPQTISKVYVYGNPGTAVTDNKITTTLAQQQGSEVLYFGVDEDLTPIVSEPVEPDPTSGKTYTANVTIKPIVARLQITNVTVKASGSFDFTRVISGTPKKATVSWTGFNPKLKGIYLNNFYTTYHDSTSVADLYNNASSVNNILEGKWLFNQPAAVDAAAYASYSKYTGGSYEDLPLTPSAGKSYAFNIFPSDQLPKIHLDLADLNIANLESTDLAVFNPALANTARFANIVKYLRNVSTEMTAADFKAGTIYNMEVELIPMLDNDLENIQFNVLVHVTIAPWTEETITPGFDLDQ